MYSDCTRDGDFQTDVQETDLEGFQPKILLNLKQNLNVR